MCVFKLRLSTVAWNQSRRSIYSLKTSKSCKWVFPSPGPGFPGGSVLKNPSVMQELQETGVWFLCGEDSLEEGMATHLSSCLENPMDIGAWRATVHGFTKCQTWLRDYTDTAKLYVHNLWASVLISRALEGTVAKCSKVATKLQKTQVESSSFQHFFLW